MTAVETAAALQEKFPGAILSITNFRGETSITLTPVSLVPLMT